MNSEPAAAADTPAALPDRIPQLDGLRGLAIGLVLVWHYFVAVPGGEASGVISLARSLLYLSWSGVDLFFVLSGFLIGGILLDHRDSPRYFRTFYIRRAFRILPIYLLLLLPFWSARSTLAGSRHEVVATLFGGPVPPWSYLVFVQNFFMASAGDFGASWMGVTWSLSLEEQFYLLLPPVLYLIPRRAVPGLCLACVGAAIAFRTTLALAFRGPEALASAYVLLPSRMDALLLGTLGAWLMRDAAWSGRLRARRGALAGLAALLAAAYVAASLARTSFVAPWMTTAGYTGLATLYLALLLLACTATGGPLHATLTVPALAVLGHTSYFLYLFHVPFLELAHLMAFRAHPQHGSPAQVLATLVAALALAGAALVSWRVLERPLMAEGRKARY
jgi:peptidoglycan/LPS O-acetylase OafA/YrhL